MKNGLLTLIKDKEDGELAKLSDASTEEVLTMVMGYSTDDITIGRMPVGLEESDFDAMPAYEAYNTPDEEEAHEDQAAFDEIMDPRAVLEADAEDEAAVMAEFAVAEKPAVFASQSEETFPIFNSALRYFKASEPKKRITRIDSEESYGNFACDKAVDEISRRIDELKSAFDTHMAEYHGSKRKAAKNFDDVLGAAQAITNLKSAETPDEAIDAMPKVPLDLPEHEQGAVKCWRDGDYVICSLRFRAANGEGRIATMAARPRVDADGIDGLGRWAMNAGIDPVTVLGALPDLAAVACGKRLVKDVAGAALQSLEREDVLGMVGDEPVLLGSGGGDGTAPLAALMYVQQAADAGDEQAQAELAVINQAARTPSGRKIAAPLLAESKKRLATGQAEKAKPTLAARYALTAMVL